MPFNETIRFLEWETEHCSHIREQGNYSKVIYQPSVQSDDGTRGVCLRNTGKTFSGRVEIDDRVDETGDRFSFPVPVKYLTEWCDRSKVWKCDDIKTVHTYGTKTHIVLRKAKKRITLNFESRHHPGNTVVRRTVDSFVKGASIDKITAIALKTHIAFVDSTCIVKQTVLRKTNVPYFKVNILYIAVMAVCELFLGLSGFLKNDDVQPNDTEELEDIDPFGVFEDI